MCQTDRRTDRQTLRDSIDRACIASRGKKTRFSQKLSNLELIVIIRFYGLSKQSAFIAQLVVVHVCS